MKNKLDEKNIELTKIIYEFKQALDIYLLIGLNTKEINKKGGKTFFAMAQQFALKVIVIDICKIFEEKKKNSLNSIPSIIDFINGTKLKPDNPNPLINFIKSTQGYKMSIWSSNSRPIVKKVLQKVGILAKFEKLITREDVKFLKPEADGFNKIWDDKIPKSQYLFIGNSEADQEAAHKAQIDFFKISF